MIVSSNLMRFRLLIAFASFSFNRLAVTHRRSTF